MNHHLPLRLFASVCIFVGFLSSPVWAQQKQPISISAEGMKSRYVQQLAIDVDDVPGHQVRVLENVRTFPPGKEPIIGGERVIEWWGRGLSNYVAGVGPVFGYNTLITDKGSKIFVEFIGTSESQTTETGSKRGTYHGTSKFVGGTGRFSKIRGYLVDVSKFDTDPKSGYTVADSRGEYWFED